MLRLCQGSWLDTYLKYTFNQESPKAFHQWTGISLLGATIGRGIVIPRIKYVLRPNLYVILVAESAKCRKSSAVNIGRSLLDKMDVPPMVFAQKITPEALIGALSRASVGDSTYGLLFSTELSVLLSKDAISRGITSLLNDLYDSPVGKWTYHTKGGGKQSLGNPTVGMLAATTKSEVGEVIPDAAVGGGFTSRIIFVYQDKPSKDILFGHITENGIDIIESPEELELKRKLIHDLNTINKEAKGTIKFTKDARKVALEWYKSEMDVVRDEKLDGYFGRKHDIMFKVATLLSVANSSDLIIDAPHITNALALLAENEKNLSGIVDSIVATKVGSVVDKVYSIIRRGGKVAHSELLRKCWRLASSQDMSIVLRTLLESNMIDEFVDGRKRWYEVKKPTT